MQDLVKSVRSAGSEFDARLMLQSKAEDERLSEALRSVKGVRSAGSSDKNGVRLVTFHMEERTLLGELKKAASAVGAEIQPPTFKS